MKDDIAPNNMISAKDAHNVLQAHVNNRLAARQELHEKMIKLDAEIFAMREAQDQIARLAK